MQALADVAQWLSIVSYTQGLQIPGQGTCAGSGLHPLVPGSIPSGGACRRQSINVPFYINVSLSPLLPFAKVQ